MTKNRSEQVWLVIHQAHHQGDLSMCDVIIGYHGGMLKYLGVLDTQV